MELRFKNLTSDMADEFFQYFEKDAFPEGDSRKECYCLESHLKDENKYISLSGCGGSMNESFVRKVVATKVENNTITITEKSIYIYNDWNDYTNKRYIYNDCQKTNLLDTIETDSHTTVDINIENYLENAATYEYIFTKENNNYIFKQFKKV